MAFKDSMVGCVPSDEQINNHYKSLLDEYLDTMKSSGEDVKEIAHDKPASDGQGYEGPMKGTLMDWTQMLEAMDVVSANMDAPIENDIDTAPVEGPEVNEEELLNELDKLYTPVLVSQSFEKDIADKTNAAMAESGLLTERNIISFDDESRMAQLISVCARLIAKQKNSQAWQMYERAAMIKKQSNMQIQKEEYDQAKDLAQKFLVKVSTSSNSSVARDAAQALMPQTQH